MATKVLFMTVYDPCQKLQALTGKTLLLYLRVGKQIRMKVLSSLMKCLTTSRDECSGVGWKLMPLETVDCGNTEDIV